ncbi:hypothetical protein [Actinokineospora sp. NBRC 105648]|uniref:hypothetical protein n=1 Tax=Actinokineospora sp. NBRC 105648 TaxID=3032206 RepID=UPI0024A02B5F|nr:hypothetical protein [Actinokineospora sp. NBRC 105648]GLZ40257.1 hypothetical protein Acsp05_38810 [Actinokineospora sp. NBRC 105648]
MVTPERLYDLARTTVTVGTLAAGVFAVVYAYRKQRIDEASSFRADAEQFNKRYQDAAVQLGHERGAVRLAGVYAMGRLADDWGEAREMCVDLLCAYLRTPYRSSAGHDDESLVRATIFDLIRAHTVDPDDPASWSGMDFDFRGGTFDQFSLAGGNFRGEVNFSDAVFTGMHRRPEGRNYGWFGFENCTFEGDVSFFQARCDGGIMCFDQARFAAVVHWGGSVFNNFNLFFRGSVFEGGRVYFGGSIFCQTSDGRSLGNVNFDRAVVREAAIVFNAVELVGRVLLNLKGMVMGAGDCTLRLCFSAVRNDSEMRPRVFVPARLGRHPGFSWEASFVSAPTARVARVLSGARVGESGT